MTHVAASFRPRSVNRPRRQAYSRCRGEPKSKPSKGGGIPEKGNHGSFGFIFMIELSQYGGEPLHPPGRLGLPCRLLVVAAHGRGDLGQVPGPGACRIRRMMLTAASCPSNNAVDVTNRTGCVGTCRLLPFAVVTAGQLRSRARAMTSRCIWFVPS